MAQLLERKGVSGSSLCPLATESGFPVICLNSKESNLRQLLEKEKEQKCAASIFDNVETVSENLWNHFTTGFIAPENLLNHTRSPFFGCSTSFDVLLQ